MRLLYGTRTRNFQKLSSRAPPGTYASKPSTRTVASAATPAVSMRVQSVAYALWVMRNMGITSMTAHGLKFAAGWLKATCRLTCAEQATLAFTDEVTAAPKLPPKSLVCGKAFTTATTFNDVFEAVRMRFRDQWSLCILLINQNGNDSHCVSGQMPNVIASLPRPTQEFACRAIAVQQIDVLQRPLPCVAAVIFVRVGWRHCKA